MARLNALVNSLVVGLICLAGCFVALQFLSTGTLRDFSAPNDPWFQAAVLHSSKPVVVKFGASWCGPCRMLDPELDELGRSGKIAIVRVDVDKHRALAQLYCVRAIPHMFLFVKGSLVAQRVGYADHEQLRKCVAEHTSP